MLIEMLLNLIYNIFSILTSPINIPPLPGEVTGYIYSFAEYIQNGVNLVDNFIDIETALVLLSVVIVIDIAISLYHFVMWIIRKIPMLGMS